MNIPSSNVSTSDSAHLAALFDVARQLGAAASQDDILAIALEAGIRLTGARRGFVMLFDEQRNLVFGLASDAAGERVEESQIFKSSREAAATAARTGVALRVTGRPGEAPAAVAVALSVLGLVSGVLCVEGSDEADTFDQASIDVLYAVGSLAAFGIDNARLRREVQRANDARSEFVRTVTHELRIPMTAIKGYTDLLKLVGTLTAQQEEFVGVIHNNVDRMAALVSDLSDIARIESGRLKLELRAVNLYDLVGESLLNLRNQIEAKRQTLVVDLAPDLPAIRADKDRLAQVLGSLLNNAHKYAPPGGTVTLAAYPEGSNVCISVTDDGYGISPADQARIFEQFFRSDEPAIREQVGWGLGLTLARRLVEMQAGQISVSTLLGEGSTFVVTMGSFKSV